jgi:hypothetical protein
LFKDDLEKVSPKAIILVRDLLIIIRNSVFFGTLGEIAAVIETIDALYTEPGRNLNFREVIQKF